MLGVRAIPFAAAATVAAAGIAAYSSSQQTGAIKKGQSAALAAEERAREQAREDLGPWREQGQNALLMTGDLSGANGLEAANKAFATLPQSPDYAFRFNESQRAVDTSAAARGLLRSGATLRAQSTLGSNLASQEFGAHYNRLLQLSQQGQSAAAGQANASMQAGNNIAQTNTSGAAAQSQILGQEGQNYQNLIKNLYTGSQQGGGSGSMYGNGTNAMFGGNSDVNGTRYTYNAPAGAPAPGYTGPYEQDVFR